MAIRLWGNGNLVNTTIVNGQSQSVVTSLQDGGYVIAWVDDMGAAASAVKFQRFDAGGKKVGLETLVPSADGEGNQDQISICTLSNGTFVIAHRDTDPAVTDFGQIAMTRYAADGGFLDQTLSTQTDVAQAKIHAERTGFRVTQTKYVSASDTDVYAISYDDGGLQTLITPIDVSATVNLSPDSARIGINELVAVYTEKVGDFTQMVMLRSGNPGTAFVVAPKILHAFATSSTSIFDAHIAALPDATKDRFVVVYSLFDPVVGYANVEAVIVDHKGTFLASTPQFYGALIEVLSQPDGSFYLVYQSAFPESGNVNIRHYDIFGVQIGADVVVNTNDTENSQMPSVAQLADGRLIVTWTDTTASSDGNGSAVRQQILDPRDGIVNGQNNPAVAETLYGSESFGDQMRGFAGDDIMYGLAGADVTFGGDGGDNIYGGRGDDTSYGGNDGDRIYGDLGDDEQYGESGSDLIYGGAGSDLMDGGAGGDTAYYSSEKVGAIINLVDQSLNAGSALGDTLLNFELIFGSNTGADTITGGGGNETILGNGGADNLNGGGGNDFLRGGVGVDTLNGGTGADKFQYTALNEVGDVIINYEAVDDFQFTRSAFGNLAGANVAALNFLSVASGHAAVTANQFFIFDQALDQLWYDADGSTATTAAVMVADLSNNINITNLDLLLF